MLNNTDVFSLIDNIIQNTSAKPSSYWLYIEDQKGLPVPLAKLDSYMQQYAKDDNKDEYCFFVCRRPARRKQKYVINLRDFFVYVGTNLAMKDYVMGFTLRIILDALMTENADLPITQELITQATIKMNTLFNAINKEGNKHV